MLDRQQSASTATQSRKNTDLPDLIQVNFNAFKQNKYD
jgi:hypothetical protein